MPSPTLTGKKNVRSRGDPVSWKRCASAWNNASGVSQPITPTLPTLWPGRMSKTACAAVQILLMRSLTFLAARSPGSGLEMDDVGADADRLAPLVE
ncbi:hypothetical protein D9M70_407920 [compost metagenome]